MLRLQPDFVVVCLIDFVEWLCSSALDHWMGSIHWLLCNVLHLLHMACSSMALHSTSIWRVLLQFRKLSHLELATPCSCHQRVTYSASRRLEGHLRHRWQHSNSRRAHPPHCLHARAHPAWWRGNGAGCLRAGQVSCTLNTDRTRGTWLQTALQVLQVGAAPRSARKFVCF